MLKWLAMPALPPLPMNISLLPASWVARAVEMTQSPASARVIAAPFVSVASSDFATECRLSK